MFLVGAGISVSAGLPDFRSKDTGLYEKIRKLGLKKPEQIFDINHFAINPAKFYNLSKELFNPKELFPTDAHYFMKLVQDKGNLTMVASQNIDSLELKAGIDKNKLFQAHGHANSAHCLNHHLADINIFNECVLSEEVYFCHQCGAPVKPDVVFFGEMLPPMFESMPTV
jgi:NAD-dependent SIR2 family protein deacetylase